MMLNITRQSRANFLALLDAYRPEQLNQIPEGYNNNLIWNFAHVIVTQQLLTYGLSGLPLNLPAEMVEAFRKGSKPQRDYTEAEIDNFKQLSGTTLQQFEADWQAGRFNNFKAYETSFGLELKNLDAAIQFNNIHEGLHLGYAMSMRKSIQ